jgi:hypothetical protein
MKYGRNLFLEPILAAGALWGVTMSLNAVLVVFWAFPFRWAWNSTLPLILKLPAIGYWELLGVLTLWLIFHTIGEGVRLSAKYRDAEWGTSMGKAANAWIVRASDLRQYFYRAMHFISKRPSVFLIFHVRAKNGRPSQGCCLFSVRATAAQRAAAHRRLTTNTMEVMRLADHLRSQSGREDVEDTSGQSGRSACHRKRARTIPRAPADRRPSLRLARR